MTVTPSDVSLLETGSPIDLEQEIAAELDLDLAIPEEVPTADDPGSRAAVRDMDGVASPWRNLPPSSASTTTTSSPATS